MTLAVTVLLPCLNEEAAIGQVILEARQGLESAGVDGEVLVVDNGSTDASVRIAESLSATVIHEPVRGYGAAYLAGLQQAAGELIFMADSDGSYDLRDLTPFLNKFAEGADFVLGSRFQGTIHRKAMPWSHRWIGNPVLTWILNLFFEVRVSDAHCGLRAIRKDVLPALALETTGMEFASEMILKASKRNLKVEEVPIDYRPRGGDSKLRTFRDGWRHLRLLLLHSGTHLFMVPGSLLFSLGTVALLVLASGPRLIAGREWGIHTLIVGSTLTLLGAQVAQFGVISRTYAILYLGDREARLERLWNRVRLEHGLLLGFSLMLLGGVVLAAILGEWISGGLGELRRSHEAVVAMTLTGLGAQVIFTSFLLSVLGLRRG